VSLLINPDTNLMTCSCLRETLRLQPVVSGLTRAAKKDFELGGYRVPEGTRLYTSFLHVSKNDPRWRDAGGDLNPMVFNPERMMTPEGQKQGWQMPFGYGPR
jgi:cytochrome P450